MANAAGSQLPDDSQKNPVEAAKSNEQSAVNNSTRFGASEPAGSARPAVRGLRASTSRSAHRLKPMAALRANTMHASTPTTSHGRTPPIRFTASASAAAANGSAKSV